MIFEIHSDSEYKYFEVTTKNARFANYPHAFYGRFGTLCVNLDKRNWYKQLEDIATYVNNDLDDECIFALG